ncbi:hypothetical protein FHW36_10232 [Chitinophaga polysaccharea]|uniref:Uncharacterized protein n=1 Tax=Chitinophaga polysaccharea TaxID=1293035 RepID=A0A561PVZ2_9BACT|nr:hypothetical protein FHW36_10232 [Chitinophaga polysaccharea]
MLVNTGPRHWIIMNAGEIPGGNSYSKTNADATFMQMKEDHIK